MDSADWEFERAVARVEPTVETVLAEFATFHVGRAVRRLDIRPPRPLPGISWSIDGELVVELVHRSAGRDQLFVHELSLLDVLRKRLRTRHVEIRYAGTSWDDDHADTAVT
jgi:hypothetical protein